MSNQALPRPRFSAPEPERETKAALKIEARAPLLQGKVSEIPDAVFAWAMRLCGFAVVALLALIVYQLIVGSQLSWHAFGWKFFGQSDWNPVSDQYGALPFIYGTIVSSLLSLVIAIPLSLGVAVFITEMCPGSLRGILSFTTELLAAIPSVVYGLWAIFVMVPLLREYVQEHGLVPGDRLPSERVLSDALKVSRVSLRQATVSLEVQGLLEVRHGGGIYVRSLDVDPERLKTMLTRRRRLPEVLEAREAIECMLARLAAQRRTDADLASIDDALRAMAADIAE